MEGRSAEPRGVRCSGELPLALLLLLPLASEPSGAVRALCSFPRSSPTGLPKSPLPGETRHRGARAAGWEGAGARSSELLRRGGGFSSSCRPGHRTWNTPWCLEGFPAPTVSHSWPFLPPTVQVQSKAAQGPGAPAGKGLILVANGPRKGSFPYALRAPELLVTTPVQPRAQR